MNIIQSIFQYILDMGAPVFVPIIMIIVGLIVKMKFRDAFSSGITLGVAFVGMSLIIGFMMGSIGPAAQQFVKNTGIELNAIDGGWTALAALAWAWPLAFLMFPLQIGINIVMLATKQTNTLNVDLWNVWGKILTAVIVSAISGSVVLAFVVAALQMVLELKISDVNQKQIQKLTQIPGVTTTHSMNLFGVLLYPLNKLLDFIPGMNKQIDANWLKQRLGIFAENHIMGFIIAVLIGVFAQMGVAKSLTLGVQGAAALTLFPMVSKLFMQALSPISDATSEFMQKRFKDREFYIGLDWPIMAGCNEIWVTTILLIPVMLGLAVLLPGNNVLPFAGIINLSVAVPAMIVTGGNLLRMVILGAVTTPVFLYLSTSFAPIVTNLAKTTKSVDVPSGQLITWSTIEYPDFRYLFAHAANGEIIGIAGAIVWLGLFVWYYKGMKVRNKKIDQENEKLGNIA
ncbi:PTS galactitol transporter subunit IIC [Neobacillus cucumis]|uniref:PTS galactitol transporter subunit IIC n=1 Tax=Neobacillus cucumis TaxID=1740721 RepID=UPI00203E0231|nr:PTS transporter subunit IIC [Neobacillus cucumis]MCM3726583.1 PTS galactitol transporter subunit IIC [Neobacillus cucumis]